MPWPLPRMTVEEAAVTESDGTASTSLEPAVEITAELAVLSELSCGATCKAMRPSENTVGVKERSTPKFLKETVTSLFPELIGIGNWPPTWKFACVPLSVVKVGSARTCARLSAARASITPSNVPPGNVTPTLPAVVPVNEDGEDALLPVNANLPMLMALVPTDDQLMPSSRVTVRDICAM